MINVVNKDEILINKINEGSKNEINIYDDKTATGFFNDKIKKCRNKLNKINEGSKNEINIYDDKKINKRKRTKSIYVCKPNFVNNIINEKYSQDKINEILKIVNQE